MFDMVMLGNRQNVISVTVAWLLVPDRLFSICHILGILATRVDTEWFDNKKHPVSGSCVGGNVLLMRWRGNGWIDLS